MLSVTEITQLFDKHQITASERRIALARDVERAVIAKASQKVQGEAVQYTNAQIHGSKFEGWQCFHCGEIFTTVGGASDHFGADPTKEPGCLIKVKVGDERGLEMELRKVEGERDLLRFQIANGTTEIENSVQEMLTNHRIALRKEEEKGYAKGLDDGRKLAMPTPKQEPVIALLRTMFDLYENGVDCYEDPDDMSNYLGKAFRLDDETFDACVNILNFPPVPPQAAAIPEGWQLVPIEPTPEMLKEICLIEQFSDNALTVRYQAMLSAAPKTGGQ